MAIIDLQAHAESAHADLNAGRLDECFKKVSFLIEEVPENPFVLFVLGSYYSKTEKHGMALLAYEKSMRLHPKFSEAVNNAGGAYRKLGMQDRAVECFTDAIAIAKSEGFIKHQGQELANKLLSDYLSNMGSSYVGMNQSDKAIEWLDKALDVNPDCRNAKWNRALALLEQGLYEEGFKGYEFGDRVDSKKTRNYQINSIDTPTWDGEKDKVVVVHGEQGIGDELMMATMIPDMAKDCKHVIYDAHPRLYKMFRRSFAHLENVSVFGTRKQKIITWIDNFEIDYKIPIGSLATRYRNSYEDFPKETYLSPDPLCTEKIWPLIDKLPKDKLNIGISWKGGTKGSHKKVRTMPEAQIEQLVRGIDANFVSLQYTENAQLEVDMFNERTGLDITHFQREIDDYELTCALINELDLIISVPQSVVHLAGVMGVKTYQLCPYSYLWQMGKYGENMPWYNKIENIWQESEGSWEQVVNDVIGEVNVNHG